MELTKPFALHITWTCYGTWLPGDPRGYVSNTLLPQKGYLPKENIPGTPYRADDLLTRQRARALQSQSTALLSPALALRAAESLVLAAEKRTWRILRGAVMANHVHVVVLACPDDGPGVRRILKGVSQAELSRFSGQKRRWWTAGGSDRYKHDFEAIENAVRYVANQPFMLAEIEDMKPRLISTKPSCQ